MMVPLILTAFLLILGSGAASIEESPPSSPHLSISTLAILTSSSPSATVYSCFFANDDDGGLESEKELCCKGLVGVMIPRDGVDETNGGENGRSIALHQRCMLEMARVPATKTTSDKPDDDTAKFSWVLSKTNNASGEPILEQYLWTADGDESNRFRRNPIETISPYHKTAGSEPPISTKDSSRPVVDWVASKVTSRLGRDGGMHRLFHHSFRPVPSTNGSADDTVYFLYLTIPRGMFIDLDDPIDPGAGATALRSALVEDTGAAPTSGASHGFVVTVTTATAQPETPPQKNPSVLSFRARVHAATVCDIEQPSFASGQHLLVWEIDRVAPRTKTDAVASSPPPPVTIEFATKLHLRYPHPSSDLEEWIDLPRPILFASLPSPVAAEDLFHQKVDWGIDFVERVWVAAGSDEDHFWIMGLTIVFCLIGVAIMLRDISGVSQWDDV